MKNTLKTETPSLQERILETAERLYAEHGLNGVSLRQISAEAGARNTNAVQYHFNNGDGLVRGILQRHAPDIEMKRAQLLAEYATRGTLDKRQLLEVLYLPMLANTESGKVPTFARFSLALMASSSGWRALTEVFDNLPVTNKVLDLISEINQPVPPRITWQRMLYAGVSLLAYAVNTASLTQSQAYYEAAVADAFAIAAAALGAPVQNNADALQQGLQQVFGEHGAERFR